MTKITKVPARERRGVPSRQPFQNPDTKQERDEQRQKRRAAGGA